MDMSTSITGLAGALAKAQPLIEGAAKDKNNPVFRSKYADLGAVVDAIRPALGQHGLSFIQVIHDAENAVRVETIIMHASGEWISTGCVMVPVSKHDAHGYGSALTYARRYGLSAAFGVAPEDDDGNAAAKASPALPKSEPELPSYTDEKITANAETWRESFASGKSNPAAMIAKISSKYTLTDAQREAIKALAIQKAPTFEEIAESLKMAGDIKTLDNIAEQIKQIADADQQEQLAAMYRDAREVL